MTVLLSLTAVWSVGFVACLLLMAFSSGPMPEDYEPLPEWCSALWAGPRRNIPARAAGRRSRLWRPGEVVIRWWEPSSSYSLKL